jgi:hypothetical protein
MVAGLASFAAAVGDRIVGLIRLSFPFLIRVVTVVIAVVAEG